MTPTPLDPYWLHRAAADSPDIAGAATAALRGDETATLAVWDYACEHWEAGMVPFEVGQTYLIQTVTLYYVGRVKAIVGAFLVLEDASWVHWTGRLGTLCRLGKFKGFPAGEQKPRTEYIGRLVKINLGAIVDSIDGPFDLPSESLG